MRRDRNDRFGAFRGDTASCQTRPSKDEHCTASITGCGELAKAGQAAAAYDRTTRRTAPAAASVSAGLRSGRRAEKVGEDLRKRRRGMWRFAALRRCLCGGRRAFIIFV